MSCRESKPMVAPYVLGVNGNAITVTPALYTAIAGSADESIVRCTRKLQDAVAVSTSASTNCAAQPALHWGNPLRSLAYPTGRRLWHEA
jgi:hypothetical protein